MKNTIQRLLYRINLHRLLPDRHNQVIMYHSIGGGNYANIGTDRFRGDVEYFVQNYEIVDLPQILTTGDTKQIALTFDDGYKDFKKNVVPILDGFEIPATVFVVTDPIFRPDKPVRDTNISDQSIHMGRADVAELVDNDRVHIGNHTKSHPQLTRCSDEELQNEIVDAKRELENEFGITVNRFCYPHGDFDSRVASIVSGTHDYAVKATGSNKFLPADIDPMAIPRIDGSNELWKTRWQVSDSYQYLRSFHQKLP